jgi:hypothetical protein
MINRFLLCFTGGLGLAGCLLLVSLGTAAGAACESPQAPCAGTAVREFAAMQEHLVADAARKDWPAYLEDAQRLRRFVNDSATGNLEVARAQLHLGRTAAAEVSAKRALAMGVTNPVLASPLFKPIAAALADAIAANAAERTDARQAFALDDAGFLPEDIDFDAATQRLFLTSVQRDGIFVLSASGALKPFASSPDHWPAFALKVDSRHRRLWATEVALDGFAGVPRKDWGRSAVLEYDLDKGTLLARIEGPEHSALGDMVLSSNGEPIVSDGNGGGVYRLIGGNLHRIDHGDFISPQTPTQCPGSDTLFVPDYARGIGALDPRTGQVKWFSSGGRHALAGIDGLYCRGQILFAVQNGTSPQRVIAFHLDHTLTRITGEQIVDKRANGDFTHGVFVGDALLYLADSGWNGIDEHGVAKPGARPGKARVMRYQAGGLP